MAASCLLLGLLPLSAGVLAARPTYLHGALGNLEVLSSESAANTRELLYELLEVREQVRAITGASVVSDPAMLVVVFDSEKSFEQFVPREARAPDWEKNWRTTSLFLPSESGIAISLIRSGDYEASLQTVLLFYANYLLHYQLPKVPLWIEAGLPDFLSSVRYRRGKIVLGESARNHRNELRASRLLPLATLCDDRAMTARLDTFKHDTELYHESWGLWHFLVVGQDAVSGREVTSRLFAALRQGRGGDGAALAAAAGVSLEKLQAQEKKYLAHWQLPVRELVPAGESGLRDLELKPATDEDRMVVLATLFGHAHKGLGAYGYQLLGMASAHPESARLRVALAALALGNGSAGDAEHYWEEALELHTTNSYAHLLAARKSLVGQIYPASLRAELSELHVGRMRSYLDECLRLNPGEYEAYNLLSWVEAYAPTPRAEAVQRIEQSQAQARYPDIGVCLAIARWRLGQKDEARRRLQALELPSQHNQRFRAAVLQRMEKEDAPASDEGS